MRNFLIILFTLLTVVSCKKDEHIEQVKLYIIAGPGVYPSDSPVSFQLSGTNIETINDITGIHIIDVSYPKGETQTVTLKGIKGDPELILEVSKGLTLNPLERVAYISGKGTVRVSFIP